MFMITLPGKNISELGKTNTGLDNLFSSVHPMDICMKCIYPTYFLLSNLLRGKKKIQPLYILTLNQEIYLSY